MIIYFEHTLTHKNANGCVCENCYLCPFESCTRYNDCTVRAKATPAAIAWASKKYPKSFKIVKIIEGEKNKWQ